MSFKYQHKPRSFNKMGFPWIVYLGLATAKVNPISSLATGKLAKRFVLRRTEIGRSLLRVLFH